MIKILMTVLLVLSIPSDGFARAVKLGDLPGKQKRINLSGGPTASVAEISCFESKDCSYDKECVALRCEDVCKHGTCSEGTYCAPAGEDTPHTFQCVECVVNFHCAEGMFCDSDYKCKVPDPCENAVCPSAAPYCEPKPYKTLPYTCVQCTENAHCPPVAGLTRSCIDGNCLFNVEGNLPQQPQQTVPVVPPVPAVPEIAPEIFEEDVSDEREEVYEDENYY